MPRLSNLILMGRPPVTSLKPQKNTYQTQPDAYTDIYAYTDPAVTDFSRIFSITVNSL